MRKGGGKEKGSGFEREVSRLIDVWWEEEKSTFWRTVISGGWVEPGDITPRHRPGKPAIWFPFIIECKCVKKVDVLELLTKKKQIGERFTSIDVFNELIVGYPSLKNAYVIKEWRILAEEGKISRTEGDDKEWRYYIK